MNAIERSIGGLKHRIAAACRVLGALEITQSTFGHVSGRLPGSDRVFIRARGLAETGVRYTEVADVIEVDLDGRRVDGGDDGYSAPVEVHIHTEIYKSRPDVYAVVHAHPAAAVLLTVTDTLLQPIYGSYDPNSLALALDGVPTFDRSILIRKPELGRELAEFMGEAEVCLMHGHGITTAANSVEEAALLAIHLDTLAKMTCQAKLLGNARPISEEDQDEFRGLLAGARAAAPSTPGEPADRAANLWRYYARFTGQPAPGAEVAG